MPLILDDIFCYWMADDEPYDRFRYSVVRKLYVELEPASTVSINLLLFYKMLTHYVFVAAAIIDGNIENLPAIRSIGKC